MKINFDEMIEYGIEINPAKGFDTYDLTFFSSPDQQTIWEQDHPHCWEDDFYSGVFHTFKSPEFASLTDGIELDLPSHLRLMYAASFAGREEKTGVRLGVNSASGSKHLIEWAKENGCPDLQEGLPSGAFYNLAFDYLDGKFSNFCLEIIDGDPKFPHYKKALETAEKAIHEKFGEDAEVKYNHAKVVVGDTDLSNAKLYFKHTVFA